MQNNISPNSLYIEVIHHPHSGSHTSSIIPITGQVDNGQRTTGAAQLVYHYQTPVKGKPWAPFRTREDFEFAEMAVVEGFNSHCTQKILDGVNGRWASNSRLTILDSNDLKESLESARNFVTQFKDGEVTHEFQGKSYTFHFKYRDPWEWLVDLVTDPTLSNSIMWYPVEKFLHNGSKITRIYDENTIINLEDKGKVSSTTKMHPIVLRAAFLPSEIRNASGNGGGVFIGLMPIVGNPNDSIESEDDTPTSVEIAQFKREVYHKVIHVIFRSIRK
ncbi:hypothetical protein M422DRAFT_261454 [Sphaerobolus stellatus SS14]|nr:hypothetical protein M422DRAFT_261454 [Sphaerobolus stellatus SS14]